MSLKKYSRLYQPYKSNFPARLWHYFISEKDKIVVMPSSVVATMKYDPDTSTLRIRFVSGMVYDYKNVPAKVFEAMKQASSKGTFLNEQIKGKYKFEKIS